MPMESIPQLYESIWQRVRARYLAGSCVSERGLQALLYCELINSLPGSIVIVEPSWSTDGGRYVPDVVIVKGNEITDVFEIKFVPHGLANLKGDIRKLLSYGNALQEYSVAIDPLSGKWANPVKTSPDLRRNFVAVAHHDAAAVWPESLRAEIPELIEQPGKIVHWYARIGATRADDQVWAIDFGI